MYMAIALQNPNIFESILAHWDLTDKVPIQKSLHGSESENIEYPFILIIEVNFSLNN